MEGDAAGDSTPPAYDDENFVFWTGGTGDSWEDAFDVSASAPKSLRAKIVNASKVSLSWTSQPGADGFCVFYYTSWNKYWSPLKWVSISEGTPVSKGSTTYRYTCPIDIGTKGTTKFQVRAFQLDRYGYSNKAKWTRAAEVQLLGSKTPAVPKKPSAKRIGSSKVKLTWQKMGKGTSGYLIERKVGSGEWKRVAEIAQATKTSWTDKKAPKGKKVSYRLSAGKKSTQNSVVYGKASKAAVVK